MADKMKCSLFVTEGPHDIAAIGYILKRIGFKQLKNVDEVDDTIKNLFIPKAFPPPQLKGDITKRIPLPYLFSKDDICVIMRSAGGDSQLAATLKAYLIQSEGILNIASTAIFCDKDTTDRFNKLKIELTKIDLFSNVVKPGSIFQKDKKEGIYIFPDNTKDGTLENILLECGKKIYPKSIQITEEYFSKIETHHEINTAEMNKYKKKALIGSISNLFRPGKTNQVAISDGKWINEDTLSIPVIKNLKQFIEKLVL